MHISNPPKGRGSVQHRWSDPLAAHGRCRARNDMAATQRRYRVDNDRGDSPSPILYISRARLGLVLQLAAAGYPLDVCKVAAVARDVLLSQSARGGMTRC